MFSEKRLKGDGWDLNRFSFSSVTVGISTNGRLSKAGEHGSMIW